MFRDKVQIRLFNQFSHHHSFPCDGGCYLTIPSTVIGALEYVHISFKLSNI